MDLRAWQLLYYLRHTSSPSFFGYFLRAGISLFFLTCTGGDIIFIISAFQVPQITGNGHWCLVQHDIFIHLCGVLGSETLFHTPPAYPLPFLK
jgi:hypothetical protein